MGGAAEPQAQPQPQPLPPQHNLIDVKQQKGAKVKQKMMHKYEKQVKKNSSKEQEFSENPHIPNLNPKCMYGNISTYVCLSKDCNDYPFYCLDCEQQQCEALHHHDNKSQSVRIKQFQKRIRNRLTPDPTFLQTVKSYRLALQEMQNSFGEFYSEELGMIRSIEQKKQLPFQNKKLKVKIEKNDKSGLDGKQMGQLWQDSAEWKDQEEKVLKFLKEKQALLLNLIECFASINRHSQGKPTSSLPSSPSPLSPQPTSSQSNEQKALHLYRRFQLQRNLALSKEGAWSSSKRSP